MNAGGNNDEGNGNGGNALDFGAFFFEFFVTSELFAANNENAGDRVDETVKCITSDGERMRN